MEEQNIDFDFVEKWRSSPLFKGHDERMKEFDKYQRRKRKVAKLKLRMKSKRKRKRYYLKNQDVLNNLSWNKRIREIQKEEQL